MVIFSKCHFFDWTSEPHSQMAGKNNFRKKPKKKKTNYFKRRTCISGSSINKKINNYISKLSKKN